MGSRLDLIDDWLGEAEMARFSAIELAERCGVSNRRLRSYFRERCGISPQSWLNEVRLWLSIHRLNRGECIKTLALELNFGRLATYYDQFRAYFGSPPLEFFACENRIEEFLSGFSTTSCDGSRGLKASLLACQSKGLAVLEKRTPQYHENGEWPCSVKDGRVAQ